jgi:hypothetical protein
MRIAARAAIISAMTRPITASKLVLVADRTEPRAQVNAIRVRRYRLVRLPAAACSLASQTPSFELRRACS